MITQKTRLSHLNLKLVRTIRQALASGEDCEMEVESQYFFVIPQGTERLELFKICLVADDEGTHGHLLIQLAPQRQ